MNPELKTYLDAWFARRHREFDDLMDALRPATRTCPADHDISTPVVDTAGDVTELMTASSGSDKLVTAAVVATDVSSSTAKAPEVLQVGHDASPDCSKTAPATCSTECAPQAITVSTTTTLLPWSSKSSSSPTTSATNGVVSTELAHDNDADEHCALALYSLSSSPTQYTAWEDASTTAPLTGCFDISFADITKRYVLVSHEAIKIGVSMVSTNCNDPGEDRQPPWPPPPLVLTYVLSDEVPQQGKVQQPIQVRMPEALVVTSAIFAGCTPLSSIWHKEHMHCPTSWPPPYLYLSWCASSMTRPIPWPSFADLPGDVHLTEPRPPIQGTFGEFSIVVAVMHHFADSQSWVGPLHICLQYELDREENVTSVQPNDRDEQFNYLGVSLNVTENFRKKPCAKSNEAIVSGLISRGASVFQLWHIPLFSFFSLELTSAKPYVLALFQWQIAWHLDGECFDVSKAVQVSVLDVKYFLVGTIELWVTQFIFQYFQWHVAWALPIFVASKGVHRHVAEITSVQLMLFKLLLRRPYLELQIGICWYELQLATRGMEGTTPCSVFGIMHHFQLRCHTVIFAYPAYMSPYSSSFVSASEQLFWESKELELKSWVSYMLEQYSDRSTYGKKNELHSVCESTSRPLMQPAAIPPNHKKMELCMAARELFFLQNQGHGWRSHELVLMYLLEKQLLPTWPPLVAACSITSSMYRKVAFPSLVSCEFWLLNHHDTMQMQTVWLILQFQDTGSEWLVFLGEFGGDQGTFQGGRHMPVLRRHEEFRLPWDSGGITAACGQRGFDVIPTTALDQWLLGPRLSDPQLLRTRMDQYCDLDQLNEHRLQWDPGGFSLASAWGQAEF